MTTEGGAYHGEIGDIFAARAASGLNTLVDRPAVLDLVGDVRGQRVLDLGCGAGHYAEELLMRGADVVACDGSESLLVHASARLGNRARVVHHDLETPLHFAEDASFDGVLAALVLHHIVRRRELLAEVRRVLRPGGWFVVSSTHPTADWGQFDRSYFSRDWIERQIGSANQVIRYQLMPLEDVVTELLDAGFTLTHLPEPRPVAELAARDPEKHEALDVAPSFIALRCVPPA